MNRGRLCAVMLVMTSMASSVVLIASESLVVRIKDKCDPTTFNAAVGP